MLSEVCAEIRNYFTHDGDIHVGDFSVQNGSISPVIDLPTKYIRIVGSRLNDGVHVLKDGSWDLEDEGTFHGSVWIMSPPKDFIALVGEITAWQEKNGNINSQAMSPFNSESFAGYSYSKSGGASSGGSSSGGADWVSAYASRLKVYRKIRVL